MFTLVDWILIGLSFAVLIGVYFAAAYLNELEKKSKVIMLLIEGIILAAIIGGCAAYNTRTESGKRHIKSWESETTGGIDRTVTVYDINGEEVAKYIGRFDIEETSQEGVVKIKFDCDGKRHIIYAQTGTVLIDEN